MKNSIYLMMLFTTTLLSGCKKSENDPFLSLVSRKARISNEWTIQNWNEKTHQTGNQQGGGDVDYLFERILDQNKYDYIVPTIGLGIFNGVDNATVETAQFIIKKNGTWERNFIYSYSSQYFVKHYTKKTTGVWNFINKGRDYKNKGRIIFNTLSSYNKEVQTLTDGTTSTNEENQEYNNGDLSLIFEINQLKSKEVILQRTSTSDILTPTSHRIFETIESYTLKK